MSDPGQRAGGADRAAEPVGLDRAGVAGAGAAAGGAGAAEVGSELAGIDWVALRAAANTARARAYAPYSGFPVGAAGLVDDGRVVSGCNVENASYGLTLCAECSMVSALHVSGGGRLVAVVCVDRNGTDLVPCGRCRQLLWEHGGPSCLVHTVSGIQTMAYLLPDAFDSQDLRTRGDPAPADVRLDP